MNCRFRLLSRSRKAVAWSRSGAELAAETPPHPRAQVAPGGSATQQQAACGWLGPWRGIPSRTRQQTAAQIKPSVIASWRVRAAAVARAWRVGWLLSRTAWPTPSKPPPARWPRSPAASPVRANAPATYWASARTPPLRTTSAPARPSRRSPSYFVDHVPTSGQTLAAARGATAPFFSLATPPPLAHGAVRFTMNVAHCIFLGGKHQLRGGSPGDLGHLGYDARKFPGELCSLTFQPAARSAAPVTVSNVASPGRLVAHLLPYGGCAPNPP